MRNGAQRDVLQENQERNVSLDGARVTASAGMARTMQSMNWNFRPTLAVLLSTLLLCSCAVGPKYHTPTAQTPEIYKDLTPKDLSQTEGWKTAQPKDDALHGKWWEIFNDPQLNVLEEKV